jgi:hypothetical protein
LPSLFSLWCWYRLLLPHLPLPTIVITAITITIPTNRHNIRA